MNKRVFETELCGRKLSIECGQLAQFANGAALVRYGDTVVLSTATSSAPREGLDFFPLSVDYEEKMYAIGKIPGGFLRREGRPSENAVLTARLIDRPLRPLFPADMRSDVSINNLVMSVDHDNEPEIAAMLGSSIALAISDIAWNGPIAGLRTGFIDGEIVICPNAEEQEASLLELTVAGTESKVCMIEAGASEVPDDIVYEAIVKTHEEIQKLCRFIQGIVSEIGKEKAPYQSCALDPALEQRVHDFAYDRIREAVLNPDKEARDAAVKAIGTEVAEMLQEEDPDNARHARALVDDVQKAAVRAYLFEDGRRVDGRDMLSIRPLSCEVDLLPRAHGSGLFQRGQTQVISVATLGTLSNAQFLDSIGLAKDKRYMHHYNFPAYSVGESRPNRGPGRREIGHGALAERALLPVLPDSESFPYAIRVVSEIAMSNGSTSQGAVCASSLALMAAGVPLKNAVAGISAGLITADNNPDDYKVFMDIQGIEDFFGDMDFKVAGTTEGITAIQVDIKTDGLSYDVIRDAIELTRKGRLQILEEAMLPVMPEAREEMSPYAPKIEQIDIPADKIREVIGSGGKVIRRITEETGTEIDIQEDGPIGHVYIASPDAASSDAAIKAIKTIVFDPEPGTIFDATVTRLMNFGAFVEFAPGKEGLVHVSKMSWDHIERVEDAVEPGQQVQVIVSDIDSQGRINLSMRDLMEKPEGWEDRPLPPRRDDRRGGGRDRGRRDDRRGGGRDRGRRDERRGGGRDRSRDRDRRPRHDHGGQESGDGAPEGARVREF